MSVRRVGSVYVVRYAGRVICMRLAERTTMSEMLKFCFHYIESTR